MSLSDLVVLELFTFLNFLLSPVWVLAHHGGWGGLPTRVLKHPCPRACDCKRRSRYQPGYAGSCEGRTLSRAVHTCP